MAAKSEADVARPVTEHEPTAVIVAETAAARARMSKLLAEDHVTVEARLSNPATLSALVESDPALLIVLSAEMTTALKAIRILRRAGKLNKVVYVADSNASSRGLRAAVREGIEAVVFEDLLETALLPTVRAVLAEQIVYPRRERAHVEMPSLSIRERQILRLAVRGATNAEIAARLFLATSTVKSHITSAYGKLGVCSRGEAASLILDPDEPIGRAILAGGLDEDERGRLPELQPSLARS